MDRLRRFIQRIRDECQSPSAYQSSRGDTERLCHIAIDRNMFVKNGESNHNGSVYGLLPFPDEIVASVAVVCISLGKLDLLESAVAALKG